MLDEFFTALSYSAFVLLEAINIKFDANISIACAKVLHTKNRPLNYLKGRFVCSGRESNPYGHFWPRDFLATLAFTQAGFIRIAKPL